jgi:DNA-binding transcriptional regulator YiaG
LPDLKHESENMSGAHMSSDEVDVTNLPEFPKSIAEKLRAIREQFGMTHDQFAPLVHAKGLALRLVAVIAMC